MPLFQVPIHLTKSKCLSCHLPFKVGNSCNFQIIPPPVICKLTRDFFFNVKFKGRKSND